jgi:predicted ATP-grasp superfamily ATP-dependent carboligase
MADDNDELVRWEETPPKLRRPVLISAFEGWNDAGDAATLAVAYMAEAWSARRVAVIDPEEFFDFTSARPQVRLLDDGTRHIDWPTNELWVAELPGAQRDVVLLRGIEPQLRWRTFCQAVAAETEALEVELVISLGALLADVPHSRRVRVSGTADHDAMGQSLGLTRSTYEGPTGIVGVLADAFRRLEIPSVSLWAAVPHYVHQLPSPKAALALIERAAKLLSVEVDPVELRAAAQEYEQQVSDKVADDDDAALYVAQLERIDDDLDQEVPVDIAGVGVDALAAEVERFLREQHREGN